MGGSYSYAWSYRLCEEGLPLAWGISLENSMDSQCFRLALLHSVPNFFFLYWSPSSFLSTVFDSFSYKVDEVLSINPNDASRPSGKPVYRFVRQKTFLKFYFFSCISTKVAINDFTMYLVISKWLRRQKCRKRKKWDKKMLKWKKNCLQKCFHSFKYVLDHSFCTTCYIFSARLLHSSHKFMTMQPFWNIWIFKNQP